MAPVYPEDGVSDLPAPASIALAMAIVRSKPPDLAIGEYIDRIIHSFQPNQGQIQKDDQQGSAAYWKAEYQRTISEKLAMEDEVLRLKSEIEALKGSGDQLVKSRSLGKFVAQPNTQTKRQRLGLREGEELSLYFEPVDDPDIAALLRQLHGLSPHVTLSSPRTPTCIARLAMACAHLNKLVSQPEVLAARMAAVCECMYAALTRLYDYPGSVEEHFNQACSRITQVFRASLCHLHRIGADEVTRKAHEGQRRQKYKSNTKVAKSTAPEDEERCNERLQNLTQIMSVMFSRLDLGQASHRWLYEGLASVLLDHVGSMISVLIFFDPHNAEPCIAPVKGLLDRPDSDPNIVIAAAELTGPYLVSLLRMALKKIPTGQVDHSSGETSLQRIEQRLQNSLMRGVFGDDEKFKDACWRTKDAEDLELDEDCDSEKGDAETQSERLIGQVWELLGWDVLAGKLTISNLKVTKG